MRQAAEARARRRRAGHPHPARRRDRARRTTSRAPIGAIADVVAPAAGETVIVKAYPSSFEQTSLDAELKKRGVTDLVIAGFMTHVCVNSTARAAFNHGYRATVVGNATATRALPNPDGGVVPAATMHTGALAALADIFAIVVPSQDKIPA